MPKLERRIQETTWRLADALAKALRAPSDDEPGDPQWTVHALETRAWKIDHPDLPVVSNETPRKEVLLQLHLAKKEDKWLVVAQNKVIGPDSNESPKALIVATEEGPPSDSWDLDSIGIAAANFFKQQKRELQERAQVAMPETPPGAVTTPPPQPMMASRRARIAAGILNR